MPKSTPKRPAHDRALAQKILARIKSMPRKDLYNCQAALVDIKSMAEEAENAKVK